MGLFGGSNSSSSAQGQSSAAMNTSGWSIKGGKASGGDLSASGGFELPWYAWLSIIAVGVAYLRKRGG